MGYLTRVTGRIDISPPVPWGTLVDAGATEWISARSYDFPVNGACVKLVIHETTEETAEGVLHRRCAIGIAPGSEDGFKAYEIETDLQRVVDLFPGRTYRGELEGWGEDNEDMWRLVIHDKKVHRVDARIEWDYPKGYTP